MHRMAGTLHFWYFLFQNLLKGGSHQLLSQGYCGEQMQQTKNEAVMISVGLLPLLCGGRCAYGEVQESG